MWDAQSDPLGTALQARALQARQQYNLGPGWGHQGTVLPSAPWEGLFQAMDEAGVDNTRAGAMPGSNTFVGRKMLPNEMNPSSLAPATGMPNYFNANAPGGTAALAGLKASIPGYQSDDEFEAAQNPKNQRVSSNVQNS